MSNKKLKASQDALLLDEFNLHNSSHNSDVNDFVKLAPPGTPKSAPSNSLNYSPLFSRKVMSPENHDKHYYNDSNSLFDIKLALSTIPRLSVSISGMLATGFVLNNIIEWNAFKQVPELFILVPVLLNLFNTLEQSLQTRLASAVSIGVMDSAGARRKIIVGNWHLLMFQSIVSGLIAGGSGCIFAWLFHGKGPNYHTILLMIMTSVSTSITSSFLASLIIFVLLGIAPMLPFDFGIISGPLISALGSAGSLIFMAIYSGFFHWWTSGRVGFILGAFASVGAAAFFFYRQARRNEAVRSLASEGWPALIATLLITGITGLLLEKFVTLYKNDMVMFLPIFNGISLYVGSFYCSEASNNLHLFQLNPKLPRKTAVTLLLMSNPIQIALICLISFVNTGHSVPSFFFLPVYLFFCNVHVLLLIALADGLIKVFWSRRMKPDALAASMMHTVGDLAGTLLLAAVFWCIELKHPGKEKLVVDPTVSNTYRQISKGSIDANLDIDNPTSLIDTPLRQFNYIEARPLEQAKPEAITPPVQPNIVAPLEPASVVGDNQEHADQ